MGVRRCLRKKRLEAEYIAQKSPYQDNYKHYRYGCGGIEES